MRFINTILVLGAAGLAVAVAVPNELQKRASNFTFFGVNESGAEFGQGTIPGSLGTHYIWPVESTIDTLVAAGLTTFRIAILMERITPNTMTGPNDAAYLASLKSIVNYITETKKAYAIIDPHNFGRYYGNIITSPSDFQIFWKTLAKPFKNNSRVIFDSNNEYHDMPSNALVASLNQAFINGVRSAGATSQYVFVEGTSWSGAWTWVSSGNGASLGSLTDPSNKIVYQMHQYLDTDGSGTSSVCVSPTIGSQRLQEATAWLRSNGKIGILGEFAGGVNPGCQSAVKDLLAYMVRNKDVWKGALWWGGGPWWGNYIFGFEPPNGVAYSTYLPILQSYI